MIKNCEKCGSEFQVLTKVAYKMKKYCSAICSKGYYHTANKRRLNAKKK
tara:strand:- start:547 stop:693 length:147 start_codon:yes stop_codon:yes gene_type:complete